MLLRFLKMGRTKVRPSVKREAARVRVPAPKFSLKVSKARDGQRSRPSVKREAARVRVPAPKKVGEA